MTRRRFVHVALVAAGGLLTLALTGWFSLVPDVPLTFTGDHLLTLGNARSYIDGHGLRFNDRLGYPGVRDGMFHATFYFAQKSILWLTAQVADRASVVVYVFYGVGTVLLFAASYWSLRRLSIARDLSWIASVAFVITPYFAVRAAMHDMLAVYFSVPFGVILAIRVAWPELVARAPAAKALVRDPLPWMLVFVVGASGLYYAFFTTMFVGVLALVASVWRRTLAPLGGAATVCAAIVVTLIITGPGTGILDAMTGQVTLTQRLAQEQRLFGLELADATTPFTSWPSAPVAIRQGIGRLGTEGSWGEWPGIALSTVILASPVVMVWAILSSRRRRTDPGDTLIALCAVATVAGIAFSIRGGIGAWFNELVTPAIRAQNRVTPFLTFLALIIAAVWIDRMRASVAATRRWMWTGGFTVALAASAWPSIGFLATRQQVFLGNPSDRAEWRSIERVLDRTAAAGISTVLQLPVVWWPEHPPIRGVDPYRFELPYILSAPASAVRWSYGLSERQPEFRQLVELVEEHRDEGLATAAAGLGFDAVLISKAAYSIDDVAALDAGLSRELPPSCRLFEDPLSVLWRIGAAADDSSCGQTGRPR
jgi:hypothetical protein